MPDSSTVRVIDSQGNNVASVTTTGAIKTDSSATTQPVSGTVTANQGTANTLSNAWPYKLIDSAGVNVATVTATGAVKTDSSAVTQPVSGSVTVSGTVTSNQGTANTSTNAWPAKVVDSAGTNVATVSATGAVKVDGSAVTQPVSGTVTANQGTANTATNAWPHKLVDSGGVNVATVTAANALKVDNSAVTQPVSGTVTALPFNAGSLIATGTTVAPTAGTAIATLAAPAAGLYEYNIWIAISGTATTAAADSNNMNVKAGSTTIFPLLSFNCSTAGNVTNGGPFSFQLTMDGATNITVNAVGNATTATTYSTTIIATRVA